MKIIIELPDWVDERHISIFAGIEEVARKRFNELLLVKTSRCILCGKCCMDVDENFKMGRNEETGHCSQLEYSEGHGGFLCKLREHRPWQCSVVDGEVPECSITWEEVK